MIFSMLKPCPSPEVREPKLGDFVIWKTGNYIGKVCLVSTWGLIELSHSVRNTWTMTSATINKNLQLRTIEYLPKGTVITLEQE